MATEQSKEKEKSESKIKTDLRQYQKKTFEVYAKEGGEAHQDDYVCFFFFSRLVPI